MSERGFLLTCPACKTPKLELLDKLASENIDTLLERITELERQLSRYQGGVEVLFKVTGVLWNETLWFLPEISVPVDWKDKNVRVIVLPEERIVGSNKTMEVE